MSDDVEQASLPMPPSGLDALLPVALLITLIVLAVVIYGGDMIAGPVQVALMLCAIVAGLIGVKNGHTVERMGKAAVDGIAMAMGAIFILLSIGALIGTWNMSGTIATMVHFGIGFLSASWFYLASALICGGVALGIGSSWTIIGTIGVALVAIATAIGVDPVVTAGAVISGAYFGDKMSPLSETTNLAPAVAGTNLYTHIRAMMATTVPSIIIALALYFIMGLNAEALPAIETDTVEAAIADIFDVGLLTMVPLVIVLVMAIRRVPPTIAILTGALAGGVTAVLLQPELVQAFADPSGEGGPLVMLEGVWTAMVGGFVLETGMPTIDALFTGGGMEGMLTTVWLIISALAFGGVMEHTGSLARLIEPLVRRARSARSILVTTGLTAIGLNLVASDQYLAIVLTARMYKQRYSQVGIAPETLSRQVEDTATVTSPLVPWNSCGAYVSATLGIATLAYLPFCFFNIINPIVSFTYALLGREIHRIEPQAPPAAGPEQATLYGIGDQSAVTTVPAAGLEIAEP